MSPDSNYRELPGVDSKISEPIPIFQALLTSFYRYYDRNYSLLGEPIPCQERTKEDIQASMLQNYELMPVSNKENVTEPTMTICIPVALDVEDPESFAQALANINNSVTNGEFEVIVWANISSKIANKDEAQIKFNSLLAEISKYAYPSLIIRPVFQFLDSTEATISNIRANYMEAVVLDCQKRGFSPDHPVLWLDADTTFVSNGSLEAIADSVSNKKGIFVHANLQFSADWAAGVQLDQLDDVTKSFIVTEIHRRQGLRNRKEYRGNPAGYIEESGLAFSIETYLRAGGVNRTDEINESFHLDIKYLKNYLYQKVRSSNPQLFNELNSKYFHYLKSARIGTSGRNHLIHLQRLWGRKSNVRSQKNSKYELYAEAHPDITPVPNLTITSSDITELLQSREFNENSEKKKLREHYQGLILRLIKKLFDV